MSRGSARAPSAARFGRRELATYAAIAAGVWLAWECVKVPVVERAPPEIAARLAPTSPEVLRRAAEGELAQNRIENARVLSADSLQRAPFNARALRVQGLAIAREGDVDAADQILTLAGNWSLRDDPAHAWLVENRLKRGDYGSAFGHADTLVRRRTDIYPAVFNLFTLASTTEPRALSALLRLLALDPPWRASYFAYLQRRPEAAPLIVSLAVGLQRTKAPLHQAELEPIYDSWAKEGRIPALRLLRGELNRPPITAAIGNGDFESKDNIRPFDWTLGAGPGLSPLVTEDDLNPENTALLVNYDGFGSTTVLEQLLLLEPGRQAFSGRMRAENGGPDLRLRLSIVCYESGDELLSLPLRAPSAGSDAQWRRLSGALTVPATGCTAQRLRLLPVPGERKTSIRVWLDNLNISGANAR